MCQWQMIHAAHGADKRAPRQNSAQGPRDVGTGTVNTSFVPEQ